MAVLFSNEGGIHLQILARGCNKNKTTQRKQDKQKLARQSFHGIKLPKISKLPRDTQNTYTQYTWGMGTPLDVDEGLDGAGLVYFTCPKGSTSLVLRERPRGSAWDAETRDTNITRDIPLAQRLSISGIGAGKSQISRTCLKTRQTSATRKRKWVATPSALRCVPTFMFPRFMYPRIDYVSPN